MRKSYAKLKFKKESSTKGQIMEIGSSNVQIFFSIYFRMRSSFASHFRILPLESIVVLESKLVANKTSWDRTC